MIKLKVNRKDCSVDVTPDTPLLWVLRETLGLTGTEEYRIEGMAEGITKTKKVSVVATAADGKETCFQAVVRIDTPVEVEYYRSGGILPFVLRQLATSAVHV